MSKVSRNIPNSKLPNKRVAKIPCNKVLAVMHCMTRPFKMRKVIGCHFLFLLADKAMLKCILRCTKSSGKVLVNRGHWHCCHCSRIFDRKTSITIHFNSLLKKKVTSSKQGSDTATGGITVQDKQEKMVTPVGTNRCVCPECSKGYADSPLVVRFEHEDSAQSGRLVYLSVYDGGVHYWSRFGRVVVSYDTQAAKWSCECCRAKVSCIHKAVSKWYLYQHDSALLRESPQVSEDDIETDEEVAHSQEPSLAAGCLYPPTGKLLEDVIMYQLTSKKIPAAIHRHNKDANDFPSVLVPKEMDCHRCNNPLRGPNKITGRANAKLVCHSTFMFTTKQSQQLGKCIFFGHGREKFICC